MLVLRVDRMPVWQALRFGTLPGKTRHRELSDKQVALSVVLHEKLDSTQKALHMPVWYHDGSPGCEKHVVLGRRNRASDLAHCVERLDHLSDRPGRNSP